MQNISDETSSRLFPSQMQSNRCNIQIPHALYRHDSSPIENERVEIELETVACSVENRERARLIAGRQPLFHCFHLLFSLPRRRIFARFLFFFFSFFPTFLSNRRIPRVLHVDHKFSTKGGARSQVTKRSRALSEINNGEGRGEDRDLFVANCRTSDRWKVNVGSNHHFSATGGNVFDPMLRAKVHHPSPHFSKFSKSALVNRCNHFLKRCRKPIDQNRDGDLIAMLRVEHDCLLATRSF